MLALLTLKSLFFPLLPLTPFCDGYTGMFPYQWMTFLDTPIMARDLASVLGLGKWVPGMALAGTLDYISLSWTQPSLHGRSNGGSKW